MRKKLHPSPAGLRNGSHAVKSATKALKVPRVDGRARNSTLGASIGWGGAAALAGMFVWSYWPTLTGLWSAWQRNQDYSGGKVVPLIAAYFIWSQRKELSQTPVRTCWWGLGVLLVAQAMRLAAVLLSYGSFEQYSLVLSIAGGLILVLGLPVAIRLKWILAFLLLMVPFPRRVHGAIALPLQDLATSSAVYGLELLGVLVSREGNVLRLSEATTVAVAEACNGLRMLTAFVVIAATLAFVVRRPAWQKAVLVLSSVPVAIVCNTLRLIVTALLYERASSELAERFFHDFAGISMMPVAVGASVGLLYLMRWLAEASPAPATGGPK